MPGSLETFAVGGSAGPSIEAQTHDLATLGPAVGLLAPTIHSIQILSPNLEILG
jgi:hypothetical protein